MRRRISTVHLSTADWWIHNDLRFFALPWRGPLPQSIDPRPRSAFYLHAYTALVSIFYQCSEGNFPVNCTWTSMQFWQSPNAEPIRDARFLAMLEAT